MKVLVTGSAGHLGEALMRSLPERGFDPVGIDIKASPFTNYVGSLTDKEFVLHAMDGVRSVLHTATLHKPHVATHSQQDFVDTNINGTLNLLENAADKKVKAFIYTSTTSVFGDAMMPTAGSSAVWVDESLQPVHKNIYGVTKSSAEGLCELYSRKFNLPCLVLRTSRFFPEADDNRASRELFDDTNLKINELLFRRADIQDVANAHIEAVLAAATLGFHRMIVSATPPFLPSDLAALSVDAPAVVRQYFSHYPEIYNALGWRMHETIGRVYDNGLARQLLHWEPLYTFGYVLKCLQTGEPWRSNLTELIGCKGYHEEQFEDGPYPVLNS